MTILKAGAFFWIWASLSGGISFAEPPMGPPPGSGPPGHEKMSPEVRSKIAECRDSLGMKPGVRPSEGLREKMHACLKKKGLGHLRPPRQNGPEGGPRGERKAKSKSQVN